jgi:hypothetical protein
MGDPQPWALAREDTQLGGSPNEVDSGARKNGVNERRGGEW